MRKIELKKNNAYNYVLVTVDGVTRFCPDDGSFPAYVQTEEDEETAQEWLNREVGGFLYNFEEFDEVDDPEELEYDKVLAGWYEWDFRAVLERYRHLTPREIEKELRSNSFYLSVDEYIDWIMEDNEDLDEDEKVNPADVLDELEKNKKHQGNDLVEMIDGQRFVICWCN